MKVKEKKTDKEKHQSLSPTNAFLQSIIDETQIIICRFLPDGSIFYQNNHFNEYLPLKEKQDEQLNIFLIFHTDFTKHLKLAVNKVDESNKFKEFNAFLETHNKKEKPFKFFLSPVLDNKNKITSYQLNGIELPKLKDSNKELKEKDEQISSLVNQEKQFKALVEFTSDWIWEIDQNSIYTYSSPRIKDLLGYNAEEIIGHSPFDIISEEDSNQIKETFHKHIKKNEPFSAVEITCKHRNGSSVILESSGVPIFNKKGEFCGYRGIDRDITERKRVEEKFLKASLEILDLYNNAPCGYHSVDENGTFVQINDTELSWLGYKRNEIIGKKKLSDLIAEETTTDFRMLFNQFKEEGTADNLEFNLIRKDGTKLPVIINATAVRDSTGKFLMSRATVFDNTKRKEVELALQENEARYRRVFENIHDVFYQVNKDGIIIELSPSIQKYTPFKSEDLIGKDIRTIYYDSEDRNEFLKEIIAKGEISDYEVKLKGKDNTLIYASVNSHVIYDSRGNYVGITGTIRDITSRKNTDIALQEKTEELNRFFNLTPDLLCISDINGYFKTLNPMWTKVFSYSLNELEGQYFLDFIHPDDVDATANKLKELRNGKSILNYISRFLCKDGSYKWLEWNSYPYKMDLVYTAARDITERVTAEEHIKKMNKDLKEINANKDKFFSIFAHDLRSPFQALLGMSELISNPDEDLTANEMRDYSSRLNYLLKNQFELLENMLEWSRLQLGKFEFKPEIVNLSAVIDNVSFYLQGNLQRKQITLDNEIDNKVKVMAEPGMLRCIIQNFISNSIKFTNNGGSIRVYSKSENGFAKITILDNGKGISEEDLQKIFKLGTQFTTRGTEGEIGSGLGFMICKEMIEKHGGCLNIESELNKGTVIKFTIPLSSNK